MGFSNELSCKSIPWQHHPFNEQMENERSTTSLLKKRLWIWSKQTLQNICFHASWSFFSVIMERNHFKQWFVVMLCSESSMPQMNETSNHKSMEIWVKFGTLKLTISEGVPPSSMMKGKWVRLPPLAPYISINLLWVSHKTSKPSKIAFDGGCHHFTAITWQAWWQICKKNTNKTTTIVALPFHTKVQVVCQTLA